MSHPSIFIVGMARSGTTLAQSIIGSHSAVLTFPETHLFDRMYRLPKWQRWIRLPDEKRYREATKNLRNAGLPKHYLDSFSSIRNRKSFILSAIEAINQWTTDKNSKCWMEKTPINLHYIRTIERFTDHPFFIHVLRHPLEASGALWDASQKFDSFQESSLEKVASRCLNDFSTSMKFKGEPRHAFITYDNLVSQPQSVATRIWNELDLEPEEFDEKKVASLGSSIRTEGEIWKANNSKQIAKRSKLNERLTASEMNYLEVKLGEIIATYESLNKSLQL